jgi:uncharacterized membrane protein
MAHAAVRSVATTVAFVLTTSRKVSVAAAQVEHERLSREASLA